tara:strand:+ start:351 stop:2036 length:1686 start_codon:yes stop_codon:yes gene_type:complete
MALLDKSEVLKGNMKYMIALISDIMDGKPVKFIVNKKSYSCKVEITKTIKQLNDAISNQEASTVQNILHTKDRPAKYHDIFETKIGNLKLSQIDKSPYSGAGGKKPDPHELMTAALILKKEVIKTSHLNQSNGKRAEYIRSLTKEIDLLSRDVIGGPTGENGFYVDDKKNQPDYVNLAKAISASNYIISEIQNSGGKIQKVYQTGKSWHSDLRKFNVKGDIKNYNSSDIVVRFKIGNKGPDHYWGISLKKRGVTKSGKPEAEPTLLNKPLMGRSGYLEQTMKIKQGHVKLVENMKKQFFYKSIGIYLNSYEGSYNKLSKNSQKTVDSLQEGIDKVVVESILKTSDEIFSKDEKSNMLMGKGKYDPKEFKKNGFYFNIPPNKDAIESRNIYFETLHNVFIKTCDENPLFFIKFLDLIFKNKLKRMIKTADEHAFHFSLITATGNYFPNRGFDIKDPKEMENATSSEVFMKIFSNKVKKDYKIVSRTNGKKHCFENNANGGAKLHYTMKIGDVEIVDLEVRYKGTLTSEPQFQVFLSTKPDGINKAYKDMLESKKKSGRNRFL